MEGGGRETASDAGVIVNEEIGSIRGIDTVDPSRRESFFDRPVQIVFELRVLIQTRVAGRQGVGRAPGKRAVGRTFTADATNTPARIVAQLTPMTVDATNTNRRSD